MLAIIVYNIYIIYKYKSRAMLTWCWWCWTPDSVVWLCSLHTTVWLWPHVTTPLSTGPLRLGWVWRGSTQPSAVTKFSPGTSHYHSLSWLSAFCSSFTLHFSIHWDQVRHLTAYLSSPRLVTWLYRGLWITRYELQILRLLFTFDCLLAQGSFII